MKQKHNQRYSTPTTFKIGIQCLIYLLQLFITCVGVKATEKSFQKDF